MPDDGPAARPRPPIGTARGEDEDTDRFVFGANPVRDRWWGRPLAEPRAWVEFGRLLADPVLYGAGSVPRGDGRPVVLVPGFLASDQTLSVMGAWLGRLGYRPRICGFITNTGCSDRALDRVERRVHALSRSHGRRVALIGHSRGGHFARTMAARRPDLVSQPSRWGPTRRGCLAPAPRRCTPSAWRGKRFTRSGGHASLSA